MLKRKSLIPVLIMIALFSLPASVFADGSDITGLWKTIDDETGRPKGVVAIYEYRGKIYGRVLCSFNDEGVIDDDLYRKIHRSPFIAGEPPFSGMDIIWDMEWKRKKYTGGKIMDPGDENKKPGIYDCQLWREGDSLIVRGQILFFGRNQTWYPITPRELPSGFKVPDYERFIPRIPELK